MVYVVRKFRRVFKQRSTPRVSLRSDPLRDRAGCGARRESARLFRTKATRFHCRCSEDQEDGRGHRCAAIQTCSIAERLPNERGRNRPAGKFAGIHTIQPATETPAPAESGAALFRLDADERL